MDQLGWLLYCVMPVWGLCELLLLRLEEGGLILSLTPGDEVRCLLPRTCGRMCCMCGEGVSGRDSGREEVRGGDG